MGLEVYYSKDILNALSAAEQAGIIALPTISQQDDEFVEGYRVGFRAALTTIALAFGLIARGDAYGNGRESTQGDSLDSGTIIPSERLHQISEEWQRQNLQESQDTLD